MHHVRLARLSIQVVRNSLSSAAVLYRFAGETRGRGGVLVLLQYYPSACPMYRLYCTRRRTKPSNTRLVEADGARGWIVFPGPERVALLCISFFVRTPIGWRGGW